MLIPAPQASQPVVDCTAFEMTVFFCLLCEIRHGRCRQTFSHQTKWRQMLRGEKKSHEAMAELFVELFTVLQGFEMDVCVTCLSFAEAIFMTHVEDGVQGGERDVREDSHSKGSV